MDAVEKSLREVLGKDAKKYLALYRKNPVAQRLTIDDVVVESLSSFEKSGQAGSSVSFYYGNVFGKPYYAVSAFPDLTYKVLGNDINPDELRKYVTKYQGLLHNQRVMVGLWYNAEDGFTYFDISGLIKDQEVAIRLGKRYNQLKIYDLQNGFEIDTGGSGEPIPGDLLPPLRNRLGEL